MKSASNAKPNPLLPDDLAQCHALIAQLLGENELLQRREQHLLHRVEQLLQRIYGPRSEKLDAAQLLLFVEQAREAVRDAQEAATEASSPEPQSAPANKGHGRRRPPVELPRIRIEHPVPEKEKTCSCCGLAGIRIGEEVTEQLEYAPASVFVIEHVQPKYAFPCCSEQSAAGSPVVQAPKPPQPIEKGLPGPGLLAHVVTSKYCDHLPLYRQERILERHGLELSRQTLCGWVLASARILEPVVEAMKARVLESKVIHTDDTPVTVREPGKGGGSHTGRFWLYLGDAGHPYAVFDFTPSRRRDGPVSFLKDFTGTPEAPRFLQADAYGGYDGIFTAGNNVIEAACMAHCRRKFYDARGTDALRAHQVLAWVRLLYDIERDAKDITADARRDLRQEKAKPILDQMKQWLDAEQRRILPKSPIGEAVTYAQNQWQALNRYIQDGDLDIDNNIAERKLRAITIGRKNYLFMGSDRGGHAAAILYSLIQSAKDHALDPFLYLRDLFLRIPTHPNKQIHQLLPDNWKRDTLPTLNTPPRP